MRDDAVKMLQLMGCPVIEAPCEAEAQCAILCKSGKLYATATDDMDALTFQTPILLKGFNTKKEAIYEINYDDMLKELDLTYPQFVDLCILVTFSLKFSADVITQKRSKVSVLLPPSSWSRSIKILNPYWCTCRKRMKRRYFINITQVKIQNTWKLLLPG